MKMWFWTLWAFVFLLTAPAWVYGEIGTLSGLPYAVLIWLVSFVSATWLGYSLANRLA